MSAPLQVGQRVRLVRLERSASVIPVGAVGTLLEADDTMPRVCFDPEFRSWNDHDGLWFIRVANLEPYEPKTPDYMSCGSIDPTGAYRQQSEVDLVAKLIEEIPMGEPTLREGLDWSTLKVTVSEPTTNKAGQAIRIVQIEVNAR